MSARYRGTTSPTADSPTRSARPTLHRSTTTSTALHRLRDKVSLTNLRKRDSKSDPTEETESSMAYSRRKSTQDGPAIQVVCLGAGGGPSETNVTGFLVRSMKSNWSEKGTMLAVDAGSHLAAIVNILEKDFPLIAAAPNPPSTTPASDDSDEESPEPVESPPPTILDSGPFAGAPFPHASARANAVHLMREHVDAYLITHPHLDHLSGFAINTAAFHNTSRPKRLSALPFTVNAIKTHIFNDIIWPNLTDEDDGVGFVSFQRLTEGGNPALGEGHSRGFIEVVNGLAVKAFKISHGNCASAPKLTPPTERRGSRDLNAQNVPHSTTTPSHIHTRSSIIPHNSTPNLATAGSPDIRRSSIFSQQPANSQPGTPIVYEPHSHVVDSTAYFIRAGDSGREILIFGDVEPDSVSNYPRNHVVWAEAAPKIAAGLLTAVLIEVSYTDAVPEAFLFGHLAPRHLIQELETLSGLVTDKRREIAEAAKSKKRKRMSHQQPVPEEDPMSPRYARESSLRIETPIRDSGVTQDGSGSSTSEPLKGLRVVIIHVKDNMMDGPLVGDTVLGQLVEHEVNLKAEGRGLGCTFEISKSGDSYYF